ncbi:MAG: transcriptional repressor [Gammaproteobacteria bacterium]|jgi:Fur family transcriptional regulator, zinc uptake regulator|nr:transcriptional repressor [Gammaproteobacteria bacterium]MBT7603756.1 transcriptional repressor [Gammaproteobacteria bacterium]
MKNCKDHKKCKRIAIKSAKDLCDKKNLRLTEIRKKVFEIIWKSHKPVKAYDILHEIKGIGSGKPPTVYRALNFLLQNGLIHKLNSQQSYIGCEHPNSHKQCYFLSCNKCGDITECCSIEMDNMFNIAAKEAKFNNTNIVCEISGICFSCT